MRSKRKRQRSPRNVAPLTAKLRAYDPLQHEYARVGVARFRFGALMVVSSVALHAGLVGAVWGVNVVMPEAEPKARPEALTVEIVKTPPPPAEEPEIEEPPQELEKPADLAAPKPEPPPEKPKGTDPVDVPEKLPPDEPPPPPVRRVVGLTLESTVEGGAGPSFAVGNTRMGETARVAEAPDKVEVIPKNQEATRIPTVGVSFTKPVRLQVVRPEYPDLLRSQGIEGDVVVLLKINEAGEVVGVRVLKPSRYDAFNDAAVAAARTERFEPARKGGKAVAYNLKFTYRFRLES